jgi:hypothetical protein
MIKNISAKASFVGVDKYYNGHKLSVFCNLKSIFTKIDIIQLASGMTSF